ncbi:MAG: CRISPR-associated ring nuclease Crn1 [Saccharolobus sp.]|jgi:hypothetical protein|uniref:CRISPR-associated ring nuclease Crn1 n=1 Tax=Saccharolobus TaxID=2100760 RepID=UPI0028CEBC4E|nr:CRISPR-associated ring nuclease Crn1 [Saccharolobus sp.]MDT7862698.1 CRISPR-associated ring nuclease Crn1 [Saccharolobus sp.]
MVRLVATLGKSPGGIAETIRNLTSGKYVAPFEPTEINIDEVIVLRTKGTDEAYYFLKAILYCCLNITSIKEIVFDFDDITSPKDFISVREKTRSVLKAGDYLDFTGGRKAISSAAVLAARDAGAHLVSSIVDQNEYIQMNKRFEELKDKAMRVYNKGQCLSYFCDLISPNAQTIVFF